MADVRAWLAGERRRMARLPNLESVLLGNGARRYALYRLRYVLVRAVLRTAFRLAEVGLFVTTLPLSALTVVLLVRSTLFAGSSLWWGALETLRTDVRVLLSNGERACAEREIEQWLGLAAWLALTASCIALAWVLFGGSPLSSFSVIDVFVLGAVVRWSGDILARTYHSGVYGVRRVHRPLWSLLLVDVLDPVVLAAAWWWLGAWGLGLSLAATGLLRAALLTSFTHRVYQQLALQPGRWRNWVRRRRRSSTRPGWAQRRTLSTALGNSVAQLDALLVLALLSATPDRESTLMLAALFHVVAPLQAAAFNWTRLFYFDFKHLQWWQSPLLLARFEAFLRQLAWVVPLPVGVLTWGLLAGFWNGPYHWLALELFALGTARSWLSLVHLRAYSLTDHRALFRLFVGLLVVALSAGAAGRFAPEIALGAIAVTLGCLVLLLGGAGSSLTECSPNGILSLSAWLTVVKKDPSPGRLGLITVDRRLSTLGRLARAVIPQLGDATVGRLSKHSLLFWTRAESGAPQPQLASLVQRGCGTITCLQQGAPCSSGKLALQVGVDAVEWSRRIGGAQRGDTPTTLPDLRNRILELCPDAELVELDATAPLPAEGAAPSREMRRAMFEALAGRARFTRVGQRDVFFLAPAGRPLAVLNLPTRDAPSDVKARLATLMRHADVALALQQ